MRSVDESDSRPPRRRGLEKGGGLRVKKGEGETMAGKLWRAVRLASLVTVRMPSVSPQPNYEWNRMQAPADPFAAAEPGSHGQPTRTFASKHERSREWLHALRNGCK